MGRKYYCCQCATNHESESKIGKKHFSQAKYPRKLSKEEKKWIKRLEAVLKTKPSGIELFGAGHLTIVDGWESANYDSIDHFQSLYSTNTPCDGGDPWK